MTGATKLRDPEVLKGLGVAALLIVAMVGVFLYERSQFGEYAVTWTSAEATRETAGGSLNEGQAATFTYAVATPGASNVRVQLTWSDDVPEPDTFQIEIRPPAGTDGLTADGSEGSAEAVVPVNPMPTAATAPGRSPEDAQQWAIDQYGGAAGQGDWTVIVTLTSAPGTTGPQGLPVGQQQDGSNDYTVTFIVETWTPEAGAERV